MHSKASDIDALEQLVAALVGIKGDINGSYLDELVIHAEDIKRNIRNDFPWHVGIYVPQDEHDKAIEQAENLREQMAALRDDLREAKRHDVREIRRRRDAAEVALQAVREEQATLEYEIGNLTMILEG